MLFHLGRTGWQRIVIVATAVLLGGFVTGLLWHIHTLPEIGLQCTFTPRVQTVYEDYISWPRPSGTHHRLEESTIIRVGAAPVENWSQLLRALEGLEKKNPAEFVGSEGPPAGEELYGRWDGEKWVRVRLQEPSGHRFDVWCKIGTPPLLTLLPSLAWFTLEAAVFFVAAFVYWKRPKDPSVRLFFVLTVVVIIAFMGGYHWSRIVRQPWLVLPLMTCAVLLPAVSLHFYQIFPRPKPWLLVRPLATLLMTYGWSVAFLVILIVLYGLARALGRGEAPGADQRIVLEWIQRVIVAYFGVSALLYLASVLCLFHGYRRARDEMERNQVRWIFFGSVLATLPLG